MTKRANGDGGVRQRQDGRWEATLWVEDGEGRRRRVYFYGATRAAAMTKLRDAHKRAEQRQPVRDSAATVEAWATEWQSRVLPASGRRLTTQAAAVSLLSRNIVPVLGRQRLAAVRPSHVEAMLAQAAARGLSASTVRQTYSVARALFGDAVRDGLLAANPVEQVKRPAVPRRDPRALPAADVRRLIAEAAPDRLGAMVPLIAATGMRRGEALALRWEDYDAATGRLLIRATVTRAGGRLFLAEPKTTKGRRTVIVPPAVRVILAEHKRQQAAERLAALAWLDGGLIFCNQAGGLCEPRNVSRWYVEVTKRAEVAETGMHALRHSAATAMLDAGLSPRVVADTLGHSDVALTLNVYAATLPEQAAAATAATAAAFGL